MVDFADPAHSIFDGLTLVVFVLSVKGVDIP